MMRRVGSGVAVTMVIFTVTIGPASADPAVPTNYEATVTGIDPPVSGVDAEVTGGDAFFGITVADGTEVVVAGYNEEPYVRIAADGEVFLNRNSPAFWMNDDRYGSPVPAQADSEAEPDWEQVADGGAWAWHDHRIHWMAPDVPPAIAGDRVETVLEWTVALLVDGVPAEVNGVLTWHPSQMAVPWVLVLVVAAAGMVLAGRLGVVALGVAVSVGGVLALIVSLAQASITPPGAGGDLVSQGAAAAATTGGLLTALAGRRIAAIGDLGALVGGVLLMVWGAQRIGSLWLPVLPSPLPVEVERLFLAVVVGIGVGVVVAGFMRRFAITRPAEG